MAKRILGLRRSPRFSPNSADRDEAIFLQVAAALERRGAEVVLADEDHWTSASGVDGVFSMARDVQVLRRLSELEQDGLPVVNSATALLRATRLELTELFERQGIPVPVSPVLYRLEKNGMQAHWRQADEALRFPLWLKRSGACAQAAGDVCFVEGPSDLYPVLENYCLRGIDEVLASEHLPGDLVKFYGVEGTDFFYAHYPTADNAFSKFGLEKINGAPNGYPLDCAALKACADRAAVLSGISVYGGDCIVDAGGRFRIIDFNDWPSFSRCRTAAAEAIADKVERSVAVS